MSKYAKYSELITLATNYSKRMRHLSNRIFNEVTRDTKKSQYKVEKMFAAQPLPLNKNIVEYYPKLVETGRLMMKLREYGLFRDEHQDFKEEMLRKRALRGKITYKRGGGRKKEDYIKQ